MSLTRMFAGYKATAYANGIDQSDRPGLAISKRVMSEVLKKKSDHSHELVEREIEKVWSR